MASKTLGWSAAVLLLVGCPGGDDAQTSSQQGTGSTGEQTDITVTTIPLPTATETETGDPPETSEGTTSEGTGSTGLDGTGSSSSGEGTESSSGEEEGSSSSGGTSGYEVSWCILQYPPSVAVEVDEAFTLYVRLFAGGLTDLTGVNDPDPLLVVELGYSVDGSDPSTGMGAPWTWTAAGPNAGYGPGSPGYSAANDEYWGDLSIPAAGIYDYAGRVSGDGGMTWVYCDLDGLTTGGYTVDQAGHAEVGQ